MLIANSRKKSFDRYSKWKMNIADALKMSNEGSQQAKFFNGVKVLKRKNEIFGSIYHIPNGSNKTKFERAKFKREGLISGVWDVHVPIPRFGLAGMYIEFKWTSSLSDDQKKFQELLDGHHMFIVVHFGDQAIDALKHWMSCDTIEEFAEKVRL